MLLQKGVRNSCPWILFFDIDPLLELPILLESPIIPQEKFVSHYTIERDPYADDDSEDEWEDEHGVVINDVDSDSNSDDELEDNE